jgi:hypothetical protein
MANYMFTFIQIVIFEMNKIDCDSYLVGNDDSIVVIHDPE